MEAASAASPKIYGNGRNTHGLFKDYKLKLR